MPEIKLREITKDFGKTRAVDNLDLVIHDGEFVTLLGPSGCGKTTTLRMIAGLESPSSGEITIGDKVVYSSKKGIDLPPDIRDIGFLFQNYALWPHMTVAKNIAFGLENLKWPRKRINERIQELVKILHIEGLEDRYPSELSGGQQQRVAIARTLATNPAILLMDEPLSNLDAKLRTEMRAELKRLHKETGVTVIYVTHDQLEAMTLSTRTCLLNKGRLQQYAPPMEVYRSPENLFVADFVGSPTMNFIEAKAANVNLDQVRAEAGSMRMVFEPVSGSITVQDNQRVVIGIRPENLVVQPDAPIRARIYSALPSGMETVVKLQIGEHLLTSVIFGTVEFSIDADTGVAVTGEHCVLFDKENGRKLATGRLTLVP
jgi:multiple sugar transport system ATP-binding protein